MEYIEDLKGIRKKDLVNFISCNLSGLPEASNILVISPDYTRTDFTHIIVPLIIKRYGNSKISFLNASGTHRAMKKEEFEKKLGISEKKPTVKFINHDFSNPSELVSVGLIKEDVVSAKTGGQLNSSIDITVNRILFSDYDLIIAISATLPHEASGYSGGTKIFFPGVSGPNVIDLFHWAAVLVGIPEIIGKVDNNARDIINEGAEAALKKIGSPVYSFNMVNTEENGEAIPIGLYIDIGYQGFLSAYRRACKTSSRVHIKYLEKPLSKVVQVMPWTYDEIWLAGKGSYKLQKPGVLQKGAEVIIYAPHITRFHSNLDMEKGILVLGYHCREKICSIVENSPGISKNVAAHVINVAGPGILDRESGKESLDFKVTLATSIPESECKKAGLSYRSPDTIKRDDFKGQGKLWIEEGGKYLYDMKRSNGK
jgi:lactate racemase